MLNKDIVATIHRQALAVAAVDSGTITAIQAAARSLLPLGTEIQLLQKAINRNLAPALERAQEINNLLANSPVVQLIAVAQRNLEITARALGQPFEELLHSATVSKACKASGWLPYRTVPFRALEQECAGNQTQLRILISRYYETHAEEILLEIIRETASYEVPEESKDSLLQAIEAHQRGLDRCVCPTLLPVIERTLRDDWLQEPKAKVLRHNELSDIIGKYPSSIFATASRYDHLLARHLRSELFQFFDVEADRCNDSFPNRNAALHGWKNYSSKRSSLNIIILTDHVFRVATHLKRVRQLN